MKSSALISPVQTLNFFCKNVKLYTLVFWLLYSPYLCTAVNSGKSSSIFFALSMVLTSAAVSGPWSFWPPRSSFSSESIDLPGIDRE